MCIGLSKSNWTTNEVSQSRYLVFNLCHQWGHKKLFLKGKKSHVTKNRKFPWDLICHLPIIQWFYGKSPGFRARLSWVWSSVHCSPGLAHWWGFMLLTFLIWKYWYQHQVLPCQHKSNESWSVCVNIRKVDSTEYFQG